MPFTLPAWLSNIWVQRAIIAVIVVAALMFTRQHYINEGKRQGEQSQAQRSSEQIEKQHVADRKFTEDQIAAIQLQIEAANQRAQADRQMFATLLAQRQQASNQAASISDEQLVAAIHKALGNQPTQQPLTAAEQRQALSCLYQLPICDEQVKTKQQEVENTKTQLNGVKVQYRELGTYTVGLEKLYTQLWNDKALPRRSPKCLWMWHCDRPHIATPDPVKLVRPAIVSLDN